MSSVILLVLGVWSAAADPVAHRVLSARSPADVLGLSQNATPDQVKAAHRQLIRHYHLRANTGDKTAEQIVQKANVARDEMNKAAASPLASSAGSSSTSPRPGATPPTPPSVDPWVAFYQEMGKASAGGSAARMAQLQKEQLKHVSSAQDFLDIVKTGTVGLNQTSLNAAGDFTEENIRTFAATKPTLGDLEELAKFAKSPEQAKRIYTKAVQSVNTPDGFIRVYTPGPRGTPLSLHPGYEPLRAATAEELHRFYQMNPTSAQIKDLEGKVGGFVGNHALVNAAKNKAAGRVSPQPGFFARMASRFRGGLRVLDPTMVTSTWREILTQGEIEALTKGTCPPTNGSPDFIRILALSESGLRSRILKSCETNPDRFRALSERLEKLRQTSLSAMKEHGAPRCRRVNGKGHIEWSSKDGLRHEIVYSSPDEIEKVEITPRRGRGNASHFLSYSFAGPSDQAMEYSAFDYRVPVARNNQARIIESETSFFFRRACLDQDCSPEAFAAGVDARDRNHFFFDSSRAGEVGPKAPFGEMESDFLKNSSKGLFDVLTAVRLSSPGDVRYEALCAALGGRASWYSSTSEADSPQELQSPGGR